MLSEVEDHGLGSKHVRDPALSKFSPSKHLGSTSETYAIALENYANTNPDRLIKLSSKKRKKHWPEFAWKQKDAMDKEGFTSLMQLRYMRSLVDPGEAVPKTS